MESRNCCTECRGVNNVYSCSNPVRRATVYPAVNVKPEVVKKEDEIKVTATNEFITVTIKKEEDVKVKVGA
ncbi:hypothetical protein CASFOL_021696 [Castilleja foliolosa]|uniref:Uncharacterized protein n=1 Tax=Castilleja foliolosa TaxID=1961234 RepID=A0ABD3CYU7_9LAMI